MKLTFNTQNVDIKITLKALGHYRAGEYQQAASALQEILDTEPQNWDARLMLGACYYKAGKFFMADNTFRLILDQCTDLEIKKKAREGVLTNSYKCTNKNTPHRTPPEFGSCSTPEKFIASWLD